MMNSVFSIFLLWLFSGFAGKYVKSQIAHPPVVNIWMIDQAVSLGKTVEINCILISEELINVYLEKDGQIIGTPKSTHYKAHIFEITNVSLENGGMYSCYLYNSKTSRSYHSESLPLQIIDPDLLRPYIFVSPSKYVCPESNTTIHCSAKGPGPKKRFYLHSDYGFENLQWVEPDGDIASFTISTYWFPEHIYHCSYSLLSALYNTSGPSDTVELKSDPTFCQKRPIISLDHMKDAVALGQNVTIHCRKSPHDPNMTFYLQRPGNPTSHAVMQTAKDGGKFFISNASWEHRGRYTCTYQNFSFISEASEAVELTIIDPDLPRPNIAVILRTVLRRNKDIILCWTKFPAKMFYLHCINSKCKPQAVKPDGNVAKFPMAMDSFGSYFCSYSTQPGNFTSSETSDDVELFKTEFNSYMPTITLSPKKEVTIGENVIIHCQHQRNKVFYLQKPGEQFMDSEGGGGKLFISNVNKEHGGKYCCRSRYFKETAFISEATSVELVIIDPDLPRPNISMIPSRMAFLGSNITIQCTTKGSSKRFYLHKDGGEMEPQLMEPDGDIATFSIMNISQSHGGRYKCSYRRPSESSISSVTSEAMDLLVEDPLEAMDFVQINTIRLAVGGVILLLLTYIVTSDCLFWKKRGHKGLMSDVPRDAETTGKDGNQAQLCE